MKTTFAQFYLGAYMVFSSNKFLIKITDCCFADILNAADQMPYADNYVVTFRMSPAFLDTFTIRGLNLMSLWACLISNHRVLFLLVMIRSKNESTPLNNVVLLRFRRGLGSICELSLLLVITLPREFFSGFSSFPQSPHKNQHSKSNSNKIEEPHLMKTS